MIQKLKELLRSLGINDVICEEGVSQIFQDTFNFRIVNDVRSATFEALGISKMKDNRVALVVDERYLSSVYTAITEAWFQRINILIVTYNANLYQSLEYIDRCIIGKSLLLDSSDIGILADAIRLQNGPYLLRSSITIDEDLPIDYSTIAKIIDNKITEKDIVFFYNPTDNIKSTASIQIIKPEHKYCVVSKYIGYLLGKTNCKCILCIPESLFAYDTNIFNFRSIPDNFCIIVMADTSGLMERIESWIRSNNITLTDVNIQDFSFTARKEVIYIKK